MCAGTITQSEAQAAIRPVSSTGPAVHEASISPATRRASRPNTTVPPSTTASFVDARKKAVSARRIDDVEQRANVAAGVAEHLEHDADQHRPHHHAGLAARAAEDDHRVDR